MRFTEKDRKSMRNTVTFQLTTLNLSFKILFASILFMKKTSTQLRRELHRLEKYPEELFFSKNWLDWIRRN